MLNKVTKLVITLLLSLSCVLAGLRTEGKVTLICGAQVDCPRALRSFTEAANEIEKEAGLKLRVVAYAPTEFYTFAEGAMLLNQWGFLGLSAFDAAKSDIVVAVIRQMPNSSDDEKNTLGRAYLRQYGGTLPFAYVKEVIDDRLQSYLLKHEIGHLLGAPHDEHGVMTPSVSASDGDRRFSPLSLFWIKLNLLRFP